MLSIPCHIYGDSGFNKCIFLDFEVKYVFQSEIKEHIKKSQKNNVKFIEIEFVIEQYYSKCYVFLKDLLSFQIIINEMKKFLLIKK